MLISRSSVVNALDGLSHYRIQLVVMCSQYTSYTLRKMKKDFFIAMTLNLNLKTKENTV